MMNKQNVYDPARLQSLKKTQMMDSPPDPAFDRLTRLASNLLQAPIALVSLLDDHRQFFKSMKGLTGPAAEARGTPLELAFCKEVVNRQGALIITDAKSDPEFKNHPAVNHFGVSAYAGIPITLPNGQTLGSFCVLDTKPRDWNQAQLSVLTDLTQSVVSEIMLREQNAQQEEFLQRFRSWMERMPIACFVCDTSLKIVEWNSSAQAVFGYTRMEAIGRTPSDLIFPPEQRKETTEQFKEMALTGPGENSILNCVTQDGKRVICKWTMNALFEANGEFDGFVAMAEDDTERQRLDDQLRQAQKMDAYVRIAGGVAHDFNNLLTVIHGNASLVLGSPTNYREVVESAGQIVHAAERAASLTRQLLTFSRQAALRAADLDLNSTVEQMNGMFRRVLHSNVSINVNLQPGISYIHADDGMMGQLLLNLVVNAGEAMPRGGQLTVSTAEVKLDSTQVRKHPGLRPGNYILLTVADTGTGISEENLPNIFEPFFSTKSRESNSGLGLAMVSGIVKQHQARIAVESKVNQGTTFRIYFPAVAPASKQSPVKNPPSQIPRGTETILLAEDERPIRLLVASTLERCGYKVLPATSGTEAIKLWQQNQDNVDLLLTDIVMPDGISGFDLAKVIMESGHGVPVIYSSGLQARSQPGQEPIVEGKNFLKKPYNLRELANIVRNQLDEKRSHEMRSA